MPAVVRRLAARVLLVDSDRRVLLFQGHDPARPEAGIWWFTPGGGTDPGESRQQAAARELREETGLVLPPDRLGPVVLERVSEFSLAGTDYRQEEEFFLVRVDRHDVDTGGFSPLEQSFVLGHRWWPRAELATTGDRIYPEGLPALLDRLGA